MGIPIILSERKGGMYIHTDVGVMIYLEFGQDSELIFSRGGDVLLLFCGRFGMIWCTLRRQAWTMHAHLGSMLGRVGAACFFLECQGFWEYSSRDPPHSDGKDKAKAKQKQNKGKAEVK